jgi:hypothetical protein
VIKRGVARRAGDKREKNMSNGTPWLEFTVLRGIFLSRVC